MSVISSIKDQALSSPKKIEDQQHIKTKIASKLVTDCLGVFMLFATDQYIWNAKRE